MAVETLLEPLREIARNAATVEGRAQAPERRRHRRSRIAGPRAITVSINEKNAALVANLSEGGMRVQALGHRLERGATLPIEFCLPESLQPIQIRGVVAWVNDAAEAGIGFTGLPQSLAHRLREWRIKNELSNAAREFMRVAGGWLAALDLMAELTHALIGTCSAAITLVALGKRPICSWVDAELPIRETIAAPIYQDERIIGHLEISSPALGAFDEQDLATLSVLAAVVSEMVQVRVETVELRAAELWDAERKASGLSARIVSRIGGMIPTIRVRLVL